MTNLDTPLDGYADSSLSYANLLKTIRDEIQAEHSLVSHRMSWYVTSQSFLMTAYAFSWGNGHTWGVFFHIALPVLGVMVSLIIWVSVSAALQSQGVLLDLQRKMLKKFQRVNPVMAAIYTQTTCDGKKDGKKFHWQGTLPAQTIPWLFFAAWLVASVWSTANALAVSEFAKLTAEKTRKPLPSVESPQVNDKPMGGNGETMRDPRGTPIRI